MLNIFIVEDKTVIGELLKNSIENETTDVSLFSLGEDVLTSLSIGKKLPDVILMDINLLYMSGIDLTRMIKDKYPDIEIIMQTVNEESEIIIQAIEAGASGYLLKTSSKEEILMAIDIVRQGGSFLTGKIARKVLQKFQTQSIKITPATRFDLTQREEEILNEIIKGATNKDVAAKYGITTHTVNMHLRKIYQKMRVNTKGEAIARFYT